MIATKAMENAMTVLKETGEGDSVVEMFNFREICELIRFKEVWAFEEKWGKQS